ncbi:MAG: hypothetical protein IJ740_07140 [Ruminococcus sp.]|nr:hypothetical protein [Ruminococcus sp.]
MKKILLLFMSAAMMLTLGSCRRNDNGSSIDMTIDENDKNDFTYGSSFFIPPTPQAYEYSFRFADQGTENEQYDMLHQLVDSVFGDGIFGKGTVVGPDENYDGYNWKIDESKDVWLSSNGYYAAEDYELDPDVYYPDMEIDEETGSLSFDLFYENEFDDTKVTFGSREYTLAQLCDMAQDKLYICNDLTDASAEFSPILALIYKDANEKSIYADILFCRKFGDAHFQYLFAEPPFSDGKWANGIPASSCIAHLYGEDKVFSFQGGAAFVDIKELEQLKVLNCGEAINKAAEALGNKAKNITLTYAQLEYSPVREDITSGVMTALPYWALYYRDSSGKGGVICVEAQTGEVRSAYLFTNE